ncbi:MAG TPA: flagellar basal body FlgE domain-containing protein [Bryobacteraceae bacterium]
MISGIDAYNPGFLANLNNIENRLAKENNEVSSGIRVNEPSDDPGAIASILDTQSQIDQVTQVQKNLNLANVTAQTADGAIQNAGSLLDQLVSIAAQGASGTTNAATESALALQVKNIQQELVSVANTSINGQYIFGGDRPGVAPYTLDTNAPAGVVPAPTELSLSGNLQSGGPSYSQNVSVTDSLGQSHTLTLTLAPTPPNTWAYQITIPASQIALVAATSYTTAGSATLTVADATGIAAGQTVSGTGIPAGTTVASISGNQITLSNNASATGIAPLAFGTPAADPTLASGTLTFNADGTLSASTSNPVAINISNLADGAENMTVNWSLFDASGNGLITQLAQPSSLTAQTSGASNTAILRDASGNSIVPGILASQIFDSQDGVAGSGVFSQVHALWQALQSGDHSFIQTAALNLKSAVTQVNEAGTNYGDLENWISQANQDASRRQTDLQTNLGTLRDADIPTVATQLTMDETALNAAISAHATLSNKTLFDYIG